MAEIGNLVCKTFANAPSIAHMLAVVIVCFVLHDCQWRHGKCSKCMRTLYASRSSCATEPSEQHHVRSRPRVTHCTLNDASWCHQHFCLMRFRRPSISVLFLVVLNQSHSDGDDDVIDASSASTQAGKRFAKCCLHKVPSLSIRHQPCEWHQCS